MKPQIGSLSLFPEGPISSSAAPGIELRPYQDAVIKKLRFHISHGRKRLLLVAPCASGKMVMIAAMIRTSTVPCMFVVHRRELIDQLIRELAKYGLTHVSVIRGDDDRFDPSATIHLASIQSLARRDKPNVGLIFIDECHRSISDSYSEHIFDAYQQAVIIGTTATPTRLDGQPLGDRYVAMEIATTYSELMRLKHLIEPDVFGAPVQADLSGVRINHGDYNEAELGQIMSQGHLRGQLVRHWIEQAHLHKTESGKWEPGPPRRTLVFASTVEHSMAIVGDFRRVGARIAHLDGETPNSEREAMLAKLEAGELDIISNVNVLCVDDQTEILTSDGWVGIDTMTTKHLVANWDNGTVTFEHPTEVIVRDRLPSEKMAVARGKRINVRVTEGHWMLYRTALRGMFWKCHARDLVGRQVKLPVSGIHSPHRIEVTTPPPSLSKRSRLISALSFKLRDKDGFSYENSVTEAARRVDRKLSLRKKRPDELTLDECKFIGYWTGDGWKAALQTGGVEYAMSESTNNPKIVDWVDGVVSRMGVDVLRKYTLPSSDGMRKDPAVRWSFGRGTGGGSQERRGLFHIEHFLEKDGSPLLFGLSTDQFDAFMEGLWMADGNHGDGSAASSVRINKSNKSLFDKLQAIACTRGYMCNVAPTQRSRGATKDPYRLAFKKIDSFHLGKDRFRLENEFTPERVWCVRTRTKNIFTRRGGKVVVMGNCEGVDIPAIKCIVHARPTMSLVLWIQSTARALRLWNGIRPLILDHAGNCARHYLPHNDWIWSLDKKAAKHPGAEPTKLCPKCQAYVPLGRYACPHCGYDFPEATRSLPKETSETLVEMTPAALQRVFYDEQVTKARTRGFKPGYASAKFKEKFGHWPPYGWSEATKNIFASDAAWQAALSHRESTRDFWQDRKASGMSSPGGAGLVTPSSQVQTEPLPGSSGTSDSPGELGARESAVEACSACGGCGTDPYAVPESCHRCGGSGVEPDNDYLRDPNDAPFSAWLDEQGIR